MEFELGAWCEGACGLALILALSRMAEHGLGPFGGVCADARDRKLWLETLGEACGKTGWRSTRAALSTSGREKRFPISISYWLNR